MRFVDLFAGLGGFHYALRELGHECVFSSEIDPELQERYKENFPESASVVHGDIRKVHDLIPKHDILCAGFPCQPFSKSGDQAGTDDKIRGTLFHEVIKILRRHRPRYFILENVGNFERHDGGNTWKVVKSSLLELGYDSCGTEHVTPLPKKDWRDVGNGSNSGGSRRPRITLKGNGGRSVIAEGCITLREKGHGLISPHHLGYPQNRERFFIVGCRDTLPVEPFPPIDRRRITSLQSICQRPSELKKEDREETALSEQQIRCIGHWNIFLAAIPPGIALPSFPIWGDEIDALYPYEKRTPWATPPREMRLLIPGHHFPLWTRREKLLAALPSYAREKVDQFRAWKINYIRQNREWFGSIFQHIPSGWIYELKEFPPSLRKLEWNAKGGERNLWKYVLQFRPSGLRAKRYTSIPALVAMTTTQIPILGPERRFLTRIEGLRLQGFPDNHRLPASRAAAFAALGNAVHVEVVKEIARRLLREAVPMRDSYALVAPSARSSERRPAYEQR